MSRGAKVLIALVLVLAIIVFAAGTTGASAEPQIVRVTLTDYHIQLSQFTVLPGKVVTLAIDNQSDVAHKLVVQPYVGANESNTIDGPVVASHSLQTYQFTLAPGVYRIECTQSIHAEKGMVTAIAAQSPQSTTRPLDMTFVVSILGLVFGSAFIIFDSLGFRWVGASKS